MRLLLFVCLAAFLFSCKSSSSKKDTTRTIDDTTRIDNTPANVQEMVSIEPVKIMAADIPQSIKVKGEVQEAWKWNDKLGENILLTSYVAPYDDEEEQEDGQTAEIYAFHYARKDGAYRQVWLMSDAVKSCPLDMTCEFIKGSATVTDLDKNGIAETKVQYATACRGDVSPAYMKLIMYENGVKYALRGDMWIKTGPDDKFTVTENNVNLEKLPKLKDETEESLRTFGRYENEKEFATAPPEFLIYARSEWLKYVKEKMGE